MRDTDEFSIPVSVPRVRANRACARRSNRRDGSCGCVVGIGVTSLYVCGGSAIAVLDTSCRPGWLPGCRHRARGSVLLFRGAPVGDRLRIAPDAAEAGVRIQPQAPLIGTLDRTSLRTYARWGPRAMSLAASLSLHVSRFVGQGVPRRCACSCVAFYGQTPRKHYIVPSQCSRGAGHVGI